MLFFRPPAPSVTKNVDGSQETREINGKHYAGNADLRRGS
jgi:hypothetical protein